MKLVPLVLLYKPNTPLVSSCSQEVHVKLKAHGFDVLECHTIPDLTQHLYTGAALGSRCMLALLGCCTEQNTAAASYLRAMHPELGVVALAESVSDSDAIRLLQSGVDAISSPSPSGALLAAVLFRILERTGMLPGLLKPVSSMKAAQHAIMTPARGWFLSEQDWTLNSPDGSCIPLTTGERAFMSALLAAPNLRASHADLLLAVNRAYSVSNAADQRHSRLSVLVSRLRNKCELHTTDLPLKSVHRWGYMFSGQL